MYEAEGSLARLISFRVLGGGIGVFGVGLDLGV